MATTQPTRRRRRKAAILVKLETTYLTDPTPTGEANAMQVSNFDFEPMAGEEERRDLILPTLGHQGVVLTGDYARVTFDVELGSSGTAGTAPAYGPLLRAIGMAETIVAGTSVAYVPADDDFESASIYFHMDGVRHILLGARGTATLRFPFKQLPRARFEFRGLLGIISDQSNPSVDLTDFVRPPVVKKGTTTLSILGVAQIAANLEINVGNDVQVAHHYGADGEYVEIVNREATGTATVEARLQATQDLYAAASARTRGALALVHGTSAGARIKVNAAGVEIGRPTYGESRGIVMNTIPLMLCRPASGLELQILFD